LEISVQIPEQSTPLQGMQTDATQFPDAQSRSFKHDLFSAQFVHAPPQSMSDSEPFLTPSEQVGAAQT
jgi:hypothetical protein